MISNQIKTRHVHKSGKKDSNFSGTSQAIKLKLLRHADGDV
jgi:hypothetical protein